MHSQALSSPLARAWGVAAEPSRGPRPKLTPEQIAVAAVGIADVEGVEAVTLSRVAADCGVVTTALYRYVDAKADLVDLMTEQALGDPPAIGVTSSTAAHRWVRAFRACLADHPWLASVQPTGMPLGPRALGWLDALVRILVAQGVEDPAGVALQLSTTVRAYAAMAGSVAPQPPPPWWAEAVQERFPALAGAFAERDLTDPLADLDAAVRRVLGR